VVLTVVDVKLELLDDVEFVVDDTVVVDVDVLSVVDEKLVFVDDVELVVFDFVVFVLDVEFVVDDLVVLDVEVLFVVEVKLVFVDEVVFVEVVTRNTHTEEVHDMQPLPNASAHVVVQLPLVVHV
jgi:hypothetical protein